MFVGLGLIAAIVIGAVVAMSDIRRGLRAETIVDHADMGIPGITKAYEGKLTNHGFWPVHVTRCDFIDDAMSPGTMLAYAVQRWNEARKQWETVVQFSKAEFCKPYPLGIVKAKIVNGWLWPGQSLRTGQEATAARDAFNIGDRARFVIFLKDAGDYGTSMASPEFTIDEHLQTNIPLRVRH